MEQPAVEVTDISNLLGEDLPINKKIHLGDPLMDDRFNSLLAIIKDRSKHAYVLRWEGNKVPCGAVVGGETLAWTQNGCVHNQSGQIVGTYDRVIEFGGNSGHEQVMIVYMP